MLRFTSAEGRLPELAAEGNAHPATREVKQHRPCAWDRSRPVSPSAKERAHFHLVHALGSLRARS